MSVNSYHKKIKRAVHQKDKRTAIDYLVYFAVVFGPAMTIPQIYDVWVLSKKDISVISWSAYLLTSLIWLFYGIRHKEKPVVVVQSIWVVMELAIIIGSYRL